MLSFYQWGHVVILTSLQGYKQVCPQLQGFFPLIKILITVINPLNTFDSVIQTTLCNLQRLRDSNVVLVGK